MAKTYEADQSTRLAPGFLRGPNGTRLEETLGAAKDDARDRVRAAVKARFPGLAPVDALPYLGSERLLERYPAETTDAYRARVAGAWDAWTHAGHEDGVVAQLNAAGFDTVGVYWVNGPAAPGESPWPPDGDTAWWSRFWVHLDVDTGSNPFGWAATTWGSGTWAGGGTWGSTATPDEVALVRRIIRKWKSAAAVCVHILVDLPGGTRLRWPGR